MTEATGRVAVVTGAARGIGQAIALRLARSGHALALGDLHPFGPGMADRDFGRIVDVASNTVWKPPGAGFVPYVASGQTLRIDGGLVTL